MNLIILITIYLFNFSTNSSISYIENCPETEHINILIVHSILTNPEFTGIRDSMKINYFGHLADKIESLNLNELTAMWQEQNIRRVNEKQTCILIHKKLQTSKKNKLFSKDYNPYYYKIQEQYMVLFITKNKRKAIGLNSTPLIFLSKDFELKGEFIIRKN